MKQLKQRRITLLFKSILICVIFCVASIMQYNIIKHYYINSSNNLVDHMRIPSTFVLVPSTIGWLFTSVLNCFKSQQAVYIPSRKLILCGVAMAAGSLSFNLTIYLSSFPFVMMLRAFNILPILLVKYFFPDKLHSKEYKSYIFAIFCGLLMFYFGQSIESYAKLLYHIKVLLWLLVFFVSDAVFPLIQMEIKTKHKPTPLQMMQIMNKWCTVVTLAYILYNNQLYEIIYFLYFNLNCFIHLIILGCLSCVGQFYVIDILYNSQELFLSFLISFRKIITVVLCLLFFNYQIKIIQSIGLGVIAMTVFKGLKNELDKKVQIQNFQPQTAGQMESIIQNEQEKT